MTNQTWPNYTTIDELIKECAKKGPLYDPQPCSNYPKDETAPPAKDRRINLGTLHVSKVDPKDNRIEHRADLQKELKLVRDRAARFHFPLLTEHMVSGYAGFVPKNQFQLGKTYQETCVKSIAELEAEKGAKPSDQCKPAEKPVIKAPVNKAEAGTQPYIRVHGQNSNEYLSPYKMANDDPEKFYISGFSGFVPRTQNKIGTNVEVTHSALNEFTDEQKAKTKNDNIC